MSEAKKKDCRTQGKYSDKTQYKNRDKRQKVSPAAREPPEKKFHKRYSNESKGRNTPLTEEDVSPVKYEDNSDYSFSQLEETKKPIEISDGRHVLSKTINGESVILYESQFLQDDEATDFLERLNSTTSWHSKNIIIHGEEHPQPRLVAWYGPYPYSYSGTTLDTAEMPDSVIDIKNRVEQYLTEKGNGAVFNSVLLNLYRDGKDSVSWHSDDELTMGICPTIASVSLGETRKFEMRPKKKHSEDEIPHEKQEKYFVHLTHGSLLIMDGSMQDDWQHRVPKEYHDKRPRINLTFRTVYPLEKVPRRVPAREFKKEHIDDSNSNKTSKCKINFDDENFPPLNSSESPARSSLSTHERAECSNLSLSNNDDLNRSSENWDFETSSNNEQNLENDMLNNEHTYDYDFATEDVHCEKIVNENDSSVEMSWVENLTNDSVDASEDMSEDVCLNNEEPPKKWTNEKPSEKWANEEPPKKWINEEEPPKKWTNEEKPQKKWNNEEKPQKKWNNEEPPKKWTNEEPPKKWTNEEEPQKKWNNEEPQKKWNVEAKEFVPSIKSSHLYHEVNQYNQLGLEDLLYYEIDLMRGPKLFHHACCLRSKVLEKLEEFRRFEREELEFLCELTDGSQSDKNQKLITTRMCNIIINSQLNRPYNYRKQNYHADKGRRYQNQGRGNNHRY